MKHILLIAVLLSLAACHSHHHTAAPTPVMHAPVVVPHVVQEPVRHLHKEALDYRNNANQRVRWYAHHMKRMDAYPHNLKLIIPDYDVEIWFKNNGTRVDLPGGWVVMQSRLQTPPDVRGLCVFSRKGLVTPAKAYIAWR